MRAFAWSSIAAGTLLAIAAFVIAADKPNLNPWPSLIAGFYLTAFGIVVLTVEKRPRDG
jgi:fucose permease